MLRRNVHIPFYLLRWRSVTLKVLERVLYRSPTAISPPGNPRAWLDDQNLQLIEAWPIQLPAQATS